MKNENPKSGYNRFLLLVAGLGGLLYGVDVGIISGALPYLEATFTLPDGTLNAEQLSFIVAAVLLGSVISTLFAGTAGGLAGSQKNDGVSGILFVISIPMIALAHGYRPLVLGRVVARHQRRIDRRGRAALSGRMSRRGESRQGHGHFSMAADARHRGGGPHRPVFQPAAWMKSAKLGDAEKLFAFKDHAWRSIFWVSLPPGILFVIGSFLVAESPRWLFRRGKKDAARAALAAFPHATSRRKLNCRKWKQIVAAEKARVSSTGAKIKESLLRRKYVIPFVLACVILACNQAHRRQFHHRLQRHDSDSGRTWRPAGALWLR